MRSLKKFKLFMLAFVMMFVVAIGVNAEEIASVKTFEDLDALFTDGGAGRLDADVVMENDIFTEADAVLDLNGHTLDTNEGNFTIIVLNDVTIKDTSAEGTGKMIDGVAGDNSYWMMIQVGRDRRSNGGELYTGKFTLESGVLEGRWPIQTLAQSTTTINGGTLKVTGSDRAINVSGGIVIFNDGEILAKATGASGIIAFEDSVVEINGGLIDTDSFALTGNGSARGAQNSGEDAKFTVTGGTLKALNAPAIYAPQIGGVTEISGGKLVGGESAIEIRAGKLTITGGELVGNETEYSVTPNGSGTTTTGAAVAIAQHTTLQPIEVTISGGEFRGYLPLSEANPQNNSEEDLAKIKLEVTGGVFETTGEKAVYSEDLVEFLKGGAYSVEVEKDYIAENLTLMEIDGYQYIIENIMFGDDESPVALISDEALPKDYYLDVVELGEEETLEASKKVEEKYKDSKEIKDTELVGLYEINMKDSNGVVELKNGNFLVLVQVDKELLKYDHYKVLYFDEEGNIKEELEATFIKDILDIELEEENVLGFETTHLSTYGVIGYNDAKEENPNTGDHLVLYIVLGLLSIAVTTVAVKKLAKNN